MVMAAQKREEAFYGLCLCNSKALCRKRHKLPAPGYGLLGEDREVIAGEHVQRFACEAELFQD